MTYALLLAQAGPEMDTALAWIERGGIVALLALFLFGFYHEWWVTGKVYKRRVEEVRQLTKELREERDRCVRTTEESRARHEEYRDRVEREVLPVLIRVADNLTAFLERRHTRDKSGP